jgi:hypothetical protein
MEVMFFRNVGNFHGTTLRYIPEGRILHNQRCENLKFNTVAGGIDSSVITLIVTLKYWLNYESSKRGR